MATEVKLAKLGQTMEEGTIISCLVKVGDKVKKGDVIYEIETDKATLEMESPAEGFVLSIIANAGQTVPVGETIMLLGAKDEKVDASKAAGQNADTFTQAPSAVNKPSGAVVEAPTSATVVKLAKLGQTMEEGTVVSCLVKVGDKVSKGAVIYEIETDKATLEMESPAEGYVKAIIAKDGETVPVGGPMLILADEKTQLSQGYIDSIKSGKTLEEPMQTAAQQPASAPAQTPAVQPAPQPQAATQGRIFTSPRARKLAAERGIDLSSVRGSGPNGRIVEKDLLAVAGTTKAAKPSAAVKTALPQLPPPTHKLGDKLKVGKFQKITAQKMLQSKAEIPCFYLNSKVDVTEMVKLRTELNQTAPVKVSFNDFIIKAMALALKQFPELTGQLKGDQIELAQEINVGLAISVGDDLVAPLVRQADQKSLIEVAQYSKSLIDRAKSGTLGPADVTGGCITLSNLGGFGIDSFIPIVVPGQATILGVGQISDTCVPIEGNILVRKLMFMTLSADHKVANGVKAAQFLDYVRKLLENAQTLL